MLKNKIQSKVETEIKIIRNNKRELVGYIARTKDGKVGLQQIIILADFWEKKKRETKKKLER